MRIWKYAMFQTRVDGEAVQTARKKRTDCNRQTPTHTHPHTHTHLGYLGKLG